MDMIDTDPTWPHSKAKTAILRAAAWVIRENGPRAATLKNIASRAGITEPAIFRHFNGVDGLFTCLFELFERMFMRLTAAFDRQDRGMDRMLGGIDTVAAYFASSRDLAYLIIQAEQVFRGYPEFKERLHELRRIDNAKVMAVLVEAREQGQIPADVDLGTVGMAFFGIIFLTMFNWMENPGDQDIAAVIGTRVRAIRKLSDPTQRGYT
ncbi:MAG: TetR/AcrR family transcriptional regulator [Spirochaetota bacterium]